MIIYINKKTISIQNQKNPFVQVFLSQENHTYDSDSSAFDSDDDYPFTDLFTGNIDFSTTNIYQDKTNHALFKRPYLYNIYCNFGQYESEK